MSSLTDLGTFDQAVWGTLHSDFFLNTNTFSKKVSYLGIHFRPILLIFLPFYALSPNAEWMILSQSLALSITVWPIYLLAKHVTKSESAALFWALAYMLNPFVINVPPWVFRPESLALPFIAIALLSVEKSDFRLLLLSCLFIVLCKEHFGVMVIGFGFLWGIRNRRWKQGLLLVSFGTVYSILVLGVIMPAFSPTGEHVMLSQGLGQVSRYSWLGHSLKEVFQTVLFHPIYVIKIVMVDMGGAKYLLILLIMFLGFPLAAPEYLLPGLADVMANMMSANPMPRSLYAYHSISLIPVLTVAAVYGSERISRWIKRFSVKELAGFAFMTSFILGYYFAPLPLPVEAIRFEVGEKASVSAQANIGAHFSQRKEIYCFPNKIGDVDTIVLRLESPTTNINNLSEQMKSDRKYLTTTLDAHLQMDRTEYIDSIESLLSGSEYGILYWNDPWLVLSYKQIEKKLNRLRIEWKISPIKS